MLLLEQQSNEQRRLEVLQEEQRQLQAKRKNKQALLDELVRNTGVSSSIIDKHIRTHTHTLSLRVHGCDIIRRLLPVIVVWPALFSFCDSKASWLHCVELQALEVIVPVEWVAEGPSLIAG